MPTTLLVDTNVFVSYLLNPGRMESPISKVIAAMQDDRFTLVMPEEQFIEMDRLRNKRNLQVRIGEERWLEFGEALRRFAVVLPLSDRPFPRLLRDSSDDFILATALRHEIQFVVSGDKDLLIAAPAVVTPRILSPLQFCSEFLDQPDFEESSG